MTWATTKVRVFVVISTRERVVILDSFRFWGRSQRALSEWLRGLCLAATFSAVWCRKLCRGELEAWSAASVEQLRAIQCLVRQGLRERG